MTIKDFEKAIAALNVDIVIDEMKLKHSDVRQVIGHQAGRGIVWDEYGRSFTTSPEKGIYIAPNENGVWERINDYPLNRNKLFDLKFE